MNYCALISHSTRNILNTAFIALLLTASNALIADDKSYNPKNLNDFIRDVLIEELYASVDGIVKKQKNNKGAIIPKVLVPEFLANEEARKTYTPPEKILMKNAVEEFLRNHNPKYFSGIYQKKQDGINEYAAIDIIFRNHNERHTFAVHTSYDLQMWHKDYPYSTVIAQWGTDWRLAHYRHSADKKQLFICEGAQSFSPSPDELYDPNIVWITVCIQPKTGEILIIDTDKKTNIETLDRETSFELSKMFNGLENKNRIKFLLEKKIINYFGIEYLVNIANERKFPLKTIGSEKSIDLHVSYTQPDQDGEFFIKISTGTDTASLRINDEEQGGRPDGNYVIKRVARVGLETLFTIVAKDIKGNTQSETIKLSRKILDQKPVYRSLDPSKITRQPVRDAVAIIIGIADYKNLTKAEYANDDARVFYDYAIRALGVKPENIKLLVDQDAEEVEIIKAFKSWLPNRSKSTTDVYVFYSGHGLPTADGQGLYLLPPRTDRDFMSRTAIQFQEINADLQAAKPKSVTIFMDACFSGQARSGETLITNARPLTLKVEKKLFPDDFTVIAASQADQISSSSPDLKHGIFSYFLMKGMEGDADGNKDGKITLGEMQTYLVENVGRQAGMMGRKQEPQLIGDESRVLIGR